MSTSSPGKLGFRPRSSRLAQIAGRPSWFMRERRPRESLGLPESGLILAHASHPSGGANVSRNKCPRHVMLHRISEEGLARMAEFGSQTGAGSPAHRDHHGWKRAVGAAAGLPRIVGHRRGIQSVRGVVEEGCRLGLEQLTLYCLSVENWKRPPRELEVPDAAAPSFPDGRARRADGAERPAPDDRPPRRAAAGGP